MNDFIFAVRQFTKAPGFTAVAIITLALGIGANTVLFSVLNAVLFKPLPYPQPDRLVTLWERNPQRGIEQDRVSGPNYLDWRAQNTVIEEMAASPGWEGSETFNLVQRDSTTKVFASYTSSSLFATLGARPLLGRGFVPEEDRKEGPRVAVLSHALWRRQFNGDSNVIGQTLTLDTYGRRDYTIVGIMPPGFGLPSRCELWLPLGWMGVTLDERRSAHWHNVIARLKPGVTVEQARTELSAIQARIAQAYPEAGIGTDVAVVPLLHQAIGRNVYTALWVLWGVVVVVLLIACTNVANLMLARAAGRQREIAVRLALGASRWRIMRQLLSESVTLAIIGGLLGIGLAWFGLRLFVAVSPDIPRLGEVALDATALGFTLGLSVLTGVCFGLAPAWQLSRPGLNSALKDGTPGTSAVSMAGRTRSALVIAEVALSLVLLVSAGLMLQSFSRMLRAERGFRADHLVTAELDFSVSGFTTWVRPAATRPQVPLRELIERLRLSPGVSSVGAGSRMLRRNNQPPHESVSIFGRTILNPEDQPKAEFKGITPDWVRALGGRVLRGRDFTEADKLEAPGVVMINETLARRYFPNEDPIGQRIRMGRNQPPLQATNVWGQPEWSEIVGVVNDIKSLHPQPEAVPEIYVPYWQWPMQAPTILVRTSMDPSQMAATIRQETKAVIPRLPPPVIRTMDDLVSETVAQPRLQAGLVSLFAVLALVLAAIGLYGVLSYLVTQRTREIGVRLALGAQRRNVLSLVIGNGMRLALAGVVVGVIAALILTRVLRSLLYEVQPTDPWTLAGVSLLLILITFMACWLPARRASRVNPMEALRYE